MLGLIRLFLGSLVTLFRSRAEMAAENLALRHQLGILLRSRPARLPLTSWDRALWAFVLHRVPAWRQSRVWSSSGPRPSSRGIARRFDSSGDGSRRPGDRELMPRSGGSFGRWPRTTLPGVHPGFTENFLSSAST